MNTSHINFILGSVIIAWSLKFYTFLNKTVFLPIFPNILDSIAMIVIGSYMIATSIKNLYLETTK